MFRLPDWLPEASPPSPRPQVDGRRIESLLNGFIAAKQDALFIAPDAFHRRKGGDAIDGEPAMTQRLQDLRTATPEQARDDDERAALASRLDLQITDAMNSVGRHVAKQFPVWRREVVDERQRLLRHATALEYDDDDKVTGFAEASASAAAERTRIDGLASDSAETADAVLAARSSILRSALDQRIANGKEAAALALYERIKSRLSPADRHSLETPMGVAALNIATDAWLQREAEKEGVPLADRAAADPALTPYEKAVIALKIAVRESVQESQRFATVKGLDDEVAATTRVLATQPSAYRSTPSQDWHSPTRMPTSPPRLPRCAAPRCRSRCCGPLYSATRPASRLSSTPCLSSTARLRAKSCVTRPRPSPAPLMPPALRSIPRSVRRCRWRTEDD